MSPDHPSPRLRHDIRNTDDIVYVVFSSCQIRSGTGWQMHYLPSGTVGGR
jgi:hypothetical protein